MVVMVRQHQTVRAQRRRSATIADTASIKTTVPVHPAAEEATGLTPTSAAVAPGSGAELVGQARPGRFTVIVQQVCARCTQHGSLPDLDPRPS